MSATKSLFACPCCGRKLIREELRYFCAAGHSYDVSREGYVNLLPANQRHSENPGDDREMVNARTRFLESGWYAPLRERLSELVESFPTDCPTVIDAGCGEGYYSEALLEAVRQKNGHIAGVDISRPAARKAAKRCPDMEVSVASVYHLPFADVTADILLDCFSPLAEEEFRRVLKPGGRFFYVVPGPRHLWELKQILYDRPYENEYRVEQYEGFRFLSDQPVEYEFELEDREEILSLFYMTPYAWKTPKSGITRLNEIQSIRLTAQFRILQYEKTA